MPAHDLMARLRPVLTPRRRRHGIILTGLLLAYSLLGFLALPGLVVSQAQQFVADKLHLELDIGKLSVNPWLLAVRIEKLSLREPGAGGEVLVAADSVYVNAQLWSSLWLRGASLAELELTHPYVNARLRRDGSLNLLQLVPPADPEDKSEANWRIGRLAITGGHIEFRDDTRPTPFATAFQPLNLTLSDLASRPDRDGVYTLHAETGDGEALDWRGSLAMKPVRSEGELRISGLKATTPWRYLQDQLPLVVESGSIGISGHYRLTLDNGAAFALTEGRVGVDGLRLQLRGEAPLGLVLRKLDLHGVHLDWPQQAAGFAALELEGLALAGADSDTPLAGFGRLAFRDGDYAPQGQQLRLARIELRDLALADGGDAALLRLPLLALDGIEAGATARRAHVSRIRLEKGDIGVRREKSGRLNLQERLDTLAARVRAGLVMPAPAVPAVAAAPAPRTTTPAAPAPAWTTTLGELDLADFRVGIVDHVPALPVSTSLEHINIKLLPRQKDGEPHELQGQLDIGTGGSVALEGRFTEQPLAASGNIDVKELRLPPFAPYFMDFARFALESGSLDVDGRFNFAQTPSLQASFQGSVAVKDFAANDLDLDERFLAWRRLAASGIDWRLAPGRFAIRQVDAERPFMRLIIGADKSLNLSHIIVSPESSGTPTSPATPATLALASARAPVIGPEAPAYPVRIDRIRLRDGAMLFADMTLKPQFATGIQDLNGDVTGITTDPASRATIALKGRVDQYGKADISGTVNPMASDRHTNLKVRFSDLELTTLTPYSAKFAGYRIDKGKLSLDLGYLITDRKLEATNKIVFNQLTLGEKVDSPDAMNLPLKLAVAILKDKDGVIDVDLPLTGSLDDPQFRVAPLVWKAFVNLMTKAATAPFKLIAGLVGGGDDMDVVRFDAGQATLAASDADKLDKLAKALAARPALGVEIRGAWDPSADAQSLREVRFEAAWQKRLAGGGKPRKLLEAMFEEKLGAEALARQRSLSLKPVGDGGGDALHLAEDNYLAALRSELVARETILDGDLRQLALDRARVLRERLVETDQVDAGRVFVLEPVAVAASEGKVPLKVGLNAN